MNTLRTVLFLTAALCLLIGTADAQVDMFARSAFITPPVDSVGWGEVVAGVDFDGDGKTEIYAVNTNMYDAAPELRAAVIYKYEYNSTSGAWEIVWQATLKGVDAQNTWPALTWGDWDGDGKHEIIWGPVNNFGGSFLNPDRILVFEEAGDGSDVMGVSDGSGGYNPNAKWTIESTDSYNLRPFKFELHDLDSDGSLELIFCDRASSTAGVGYKFGVVSVSDIPDNGDGSETWTLEASGKGLPTASSTVYDFAVLDSTAYFFHATTSGTVSRIRFRDGAYIVDSASVALTPLAPTGLSGGWKNVQVIDIDGDGTKELIGAGYSSSTNNRIWLLEVTDGGDSLQATDLYDPDAMVGPSSRLLGSEAADIDGDGNIDIVWGSHTPAVKGTILRQEYKGAGDIKDPASYDWTILDQGFGEGGERFDMFQFFNADGDADLEMIAGSGYGGPWELPFVIYDRITVPMAATDIATVRTDSDGDGIPNDSGSVVYVMGVVNSVNFGGSSFGSYHIEDGTGGINVYINSSDRPDLEVGERIWVKGTLIQYNGLDEVATTTDSATILTDVLRLGPTYNNIVTPATLTLEQYLANPEAYESRLLKITGIAKKPGGTTTWPGPTSSSTNLTFWDGYNSFTVRIDSDTDIRGTTEPTYPVDVVGIGNQFDSSTPRTSGYQIFPNRRTDFTEGVAVSPNKHFNLVLPADGSTITLSDGFIQPFSWNAALDLNGDALQYQWVPVGGAAVGTGNSAADTFLVRTGEELKAFLGAADTVELRWTVLVKDAGPVVNNADTFTVTIVRGTITGVAEAEVPTEFGLSQNYPNPFNPSTTIEYALPTAANVTLRVYNMLGQEVANLVNETRPAGFMQVVWNGRDGTGAQVASGTYLYRIEARAVDGSKVFVQNRKMILLK